MSMPVSTRTDGSAGGNAWSPTRLLVPVVPDPVERFNGVHERLSQAKTERAIRAMDAIAGAVNTLPTSLLVRFARSQVETVDFATSNVRAASFDLYISGAKILNYPMGPTGGTALNATMMSYGGSLDIGLNLDAAAVEDAELLRASCSRKRSRNCWPRAPDGAWYQLTCSARSVSRERTSSRRSATSSAERSSRFNMSARALSMTPRASVMTSGCWISVMRVAPLP